MEIRRRLMLLLHIRKFIIIAQTHITHRRTSTSSTAMQLYKKTAKNNSHFIFDFEFIHRYEEADKKAVWSGLCFETNICVHNGY